MLVPPPPSIVPVTAAASPKMKLSLPEPPLRFSMPEKLTGPAMATPLSVPEPVPARLQVLAVLEPTSVLVPLPPVRLSVLPAAVLCRAAQVHHVAVAAVAEQDGRNTALFEMLQ